MCPRRGVSALLFVVLGACSDGTGAPLDVELPDPAAGETAFVQECSTCHGSGDGFDLALFGFPDSTIVRRATAHVDTAAALDIVAHVRSLQTRVAGRTARPFQPGGRPASDDVDFARGLFGSDAWPAGLDEAALLAIDPRHVPTALEFPLWSDERSNLDWMPDAPLSLALLQSDGGLTEALLAGYYASPSDRNLERAVIGLRVASVRAPDIVPPCSLDDAGHLADPTVCFNTTRWIAALGAQQMLRAGDQVTASRVIHDSFWDVGMAARRSLVKNRTPVEAAEENWALWMYVGWVFEPGNHASTYTASGLQRVGLPRHATFVALRSLVARGERSMAPYKDLRVAAQHAPMHWLIDAFETGIGVLEARDARGWRPATAEGRAEAAEALEGAARVLERRSDASAARALAERTRALAARL